MRRLNIKDLMQKRLNEKRNVSTLISTYISHKNSETYTPAPFFNAGCKFVWSFLTTNALHSIARLGRTLNQWEG